jgi:hypothetical protein
LEIKLVALLKPATTAVVATPLAITLSATAWSITATTAATPVVIVVTVVSATKILLPTTTTTATAASVIISFKILIAVFNVWRVAKF